VGTLNKIRNIFIIFILSGLWHGANWTFIVWGLLNAIYFIPLMLTNKNRNNIEIVSQGKYFPTLKELLLMLMTFGLTVFAWIFFRAEHLSHAFGIINEIFSVTFFKIPYYPGLGYAKSTIVLIIFFLIVEWLGRENNHVLERIDKSLNNTQRKLFYLFIVHLMVLFGTAQEQFIYFQF
jgi:D-alanyl-lipoteichoic acid acyltransferase DltB (MBOAT superfamily)